MKRKLLLPIGLFFLAVTFIISHVTVIPDFVDGFLRGIGIGLTILSLIMQKFKPVR